MGAPRPSDRSRNRKVDDARGRSPRRRPYKAPELTEYGSVVKLTQGTRTVFSDGAMGGFLVMMFCL
jgi:hypothetical protein